MATTQSTQDLAPAGYACERCGRPYLPSHAKQRFCGRACGAAYGHEARDLVSDKNPNWRGGNSTLNCEWCGDEFAVPPHRSKSARFCTLECANDWQKLNRPGRGDKKGGRVLVSCSQCSQDFETYRSWAPKAKFCGPQCHSAWRSGRMAAQSNPNWLGGISRLPYPFDWSRISAAIIKRDGGICQNPLCRDDCKIINVHHIDYDKSNCEKSNLITVCSACNGRANFHRDWWRNLYETLMGARGMFGERVYERFEGRLR